MNQLKKGDLVSYYGAVGTVKFIGGGVEELIAVKFENEDNIHMIDNSNLVKINECIKSKIESYLQMIQDKNKEVDENILCDLIQQWLFDYEMDKQYRPETISI